VFLKGDLVRWIKEHKLENGDIINDKINTNLSIVSYNRKETADNYGISYYYC